MGLRMVARRSVRFRAVERHGARNVRVFGSIARGEDTERSDVDLPLTYRAGRLCSTWSACNAPSSRNLAFPSTF